MVPTAPDSVLPSSDCALADCWFGVGVCEPCDGGGSRVPDAHTGVSGAVASMSQGGSSRREATATHGGVVGPSQGPHRGTRDTPTVSALFDGLSSDDQD